MSAEGISALCSALGAPSPELHEIQSQLFARDREEVLPFLDWLCSGFISKDNVLTAKELEMYVRFRLILTDSFQQIDAEGIALSEESLKKELEFDRRTDQATWVSSLRFTSVFI
jgi:hypothetical protein